MDTRVGVFLCNCGGCVKNIDFDAVAQKISSMPGVACLNLSSDLCLEAGREKLIACIRDESLDRVVVAACSPEFAEHIFRQALEDAGLNRHLLSMANVREQCSWAHEGDVTGKAVELIRMAVSRARILQAVEDKWLAVERGVLVIGGGFSAISAALWLSSSGLPTTVVDDAAIPGTGDRELDSLYGLDVRSLVAVAECDENIELVTSARVVAVEGVVGDFTVKMTKQGEDIRRKYGAIVVATGCRSQLSPACDSGREQDCAEISMKNTVSQGQLAARLENPALGPRPASIAFMLDFADDNSRFSTLATLSNALTAKRVWNSEIYVYCRDVKVDSEGAERLYKEARDCGVVFLKCPAPPRITADNGRIEIRARDVLLGEDTSTTCDLLVAEEFVRPSAGTAALGSLLNVRLDFKGFYQDENVHLYPVASERKGVFFIGGCRGQSDIDRVLGDISSVVVSIQQFLSAGKIVVQSERVKADPQKCVACLTCIRVCPHGAIQLLGVDGGKEKAVVSDLACDACGICAGVCPAKAIEFQGYRDDQILAQIDAIGEA